jgi:hypothetical protein
MKAAEVRLVGALLIGTLLNFASYVVLRRELAPGEFGAVNSVLGLVEVLAMPLLALPLISRHPLLPPEETARWRAEEPTVMRLATIGWGGVAFVLLFSLLPFLSLPRVSLQMAAFLAVEVAIAAKLGGRLCHATHRAGLLVGLGLAGATVRLTASAIGAHAYPVAEMGVGSFALGGALMAIPALQDYEFPPVGAEGWALLRRLLLPILATVSVILAIVLFSNAHRIVAQPAFGAPDPANFGFVDLARFDDFQAAGILAKGVLACALLPLTVFGLRRAALPRTTRASLRLFWVFLGMLVAGVVLLVAAAPLANSIFTGNPAQFLPGFAAAVLMLGLLQGAGVFALASRRWVECFVFGACGIAYTFFLFFAGHQPQLMTTCMFGGALISLMLVLGVGVIRYARSHP